MELFKLLAHGAKPGAAAAAPAPAPSSSTKRDAATITTGAGEDEGPFFDLQLSLPLHEDEDLPHRENQQSSSDAESEDDDGAQEFDLEMSPHGGGKHGRARRRDSVLSLSLSDGLFFKGRLVRLEPSSSTDFPASELPKSTSKPQVPAFLLKSAARLRVFKLGFHSRSKSASLAPNPAASSAKTSKTPFNVEEAPPESLFARDTSSRSSIGGISARLYADDGLPASDERKVRSDVLQRYLSKIKPFYVRISRRYGEKLRFSGPLSSSGVGKVRPSGERGGQANEEPASAARSLSGSVKPSRDGNIPAGLRVVSRRLRKSRSASSAVASVRSPPPPPPPASVRRDDSLLEQQDGIQSAIAHCKRSFNRGSESPLMRSRSDSGDGRSLEFSSSYSNV